MTSPGQTEAARAAAHRKYSWRKRLRYRGGETLLRGPFIWWRHRGLRPADVFIATYPRSGYTWLRFLVFDILTGKSSQFREVDQAIPYVARHAQALTLLPQGGRLIATHESYRREYKRAIYMARDARDVAVSEFLREQAKGLVRDFDDYLSRFLSGKKRHGSWAEHVASWLDSETARRGQLLVIKYEDLHVQPETTLRRVMEFLGVKVEGAGIARAIADNTVAKMRHKEDQSGVTFQGSGDDGRFVRQGAMGGWRERLTWQRAGIIEKCSQAALLRLGYPLAFQGETELPARGTAGPISEEESLPQAAEVAGRSTKTWED